jgi:inositol-pentakisphosphate 2-kinase
MRSVATGASNASEPKRLMEQPPVVPSPSAPVLSDVDTTTPTDWRYINEGGATIVFAYAGPPHPTLTGKVLRLRKTSSRQPGAPSPDEPDDPSIAFQYNVTSRLIPSANLPALDPVHVQSSWLESLAHAADTLRPASRRDKDQLDTSRSKGVLATDLIGGPGLAVEIKVTSSYPYVLRLHAERLF